MKLDIYKRAEADGMFSYLAVPEGEIIPDEATNIDWQDAERGVEFDENEDALPAYAINRPIEQITSKGYAITSVNDIGMASGNH
ncbi:MAG: DUF6139 family protein [Pseudomonadota bacterium]